MVKTAELILLYFCDHIEEQLDPSNRKNPPQIFSQPGMRYSLGVPKRSVARGAKALVKENLVEVKKIYVEKTGRYRNFYFLTQEGIVKGKELQEKIGKRKVKVREKEELKELKISELIEHLKKIAKKPIERGSSYLVKGEKSKEAYEIFKDLLAEGYGGIVISDISPKKIEKGYKIKEEMFWLSEVEGENVLKPDKLDFEIMATISNFLRDNEKPVIMLEGLGYLSEVNSFDACLRWLKTITDLIAKNDGILILPLNPAILSEKELSLLSQTLEVYEPKEIAPVEINYTNIIKNITPEGYLDIRTILEPKRYVDYSNRKPEFRYFVGREKELKEINDFMGSESKILCVKGIAGIGKTVLLSKFLEDVEMNVFWHRFSEFTTLRSLLTKASDFLSRMERRKLENYLKGERFEVEEILILLEQELKSSNSLLVFDDFQKASEEVVDLFRYFKDLKMDVKTIVLGRTIPLFYDKRDIVIKKNIKEIVLRGLDKENSIKLLKHRKIEKDLEKMYYATKGHPLLLELITPETKFEAEKYIKEEIIRKLKDEERRALEIASVFRYPFPSRAIVDGADYDTIDNLVDKSLMQRSGEIYDLHDIIREFIYDKLSEKQKLEYHRAAAEYYEKEKGGGAVIEAMYHFLKGDNYEKAATLIVEEGVELVEKGFSKELYELIKQISKNQISTARWAEILHVKSLVCKFIGKWDTTLNLAKECINISKELDNKKLQGESYRQIGEILTAKGEYDEALGNLRSALKISEEIDDVQGRCKARYWLGKASWRVGKLDDAMKNLKKCFDIARETGDTAMMAKAIMDIGTVHMWRGEYKESLEHKIRSLSISEKLDDKYEIARAYNNIGVTYERMRDRERAVEWFEKCIDIGRKIGDLRGVGYGLSGAGYNYAVINQLDKAKEYLDEALNIFTRLGEKPIISSCYDIYGIIYHKKNEWDKSIESFERAIKIAREAERLEGLSGTYFDYGKMFADKGDKDKAREQFEKSIEVYEKLGNKAKVEEVKRELAELEKGN